MPKIIVDPASTSLQNRFALIMAPRKSRKRFPAGCVTIYDTEQEAVDAADHANKLIPAVIYGPSTSSEGTQIYYLVRWLG